MGSANSGGEDAPVDADGAAVSGRAPSNWMEIGAGGSCASNRRCRLTCPMLHDAGYFSKEAATMTYYVTLVSHHPPRS